MKTHHDAGFGLALFVGDSVFPISLGEKRKDKPINTRGRFNDMRDVVAPGQGFGVFASLSGGVVGGLSGACQVAEP